MSQQALKTFPFPSIMTPRQKDIFWFRFSKQCTVYCIFTHRAKKDDNELSCKFLIGARHIVCSVLILFFDWGYFVLKKTTRRRILVEHQTTEGSNFASQCSWCAAGSLCYAVQCLSYTVNCLYCCELTGPLLWVGVSPAPWSCRWCCSAVAVQLNKKISFSSDSVYSYCIFITVNTPHKKDNMVSMLR